MNLLKKDYIFEDEIILNYYNYDIIKKKIDENKIAKIFKNFKI